MRRAFIYFNTNERWKFGNRGIIHWPSNEEVHLLNLCILLGHKAGNVFAVVIVEAPATYVSDAIVFELEVSKAICL